MAAGTSHVQNGVSNGCAKEVVLVTGFGPFGVHKTNASWEAVRELEKLGLGDEYELAIEKLDVEYDKVDSIVPQLWEKYKPKLVIHCGVSGIAKEITLEQRGHRKGYEAKDESGKTPIDKTCNCNGLDCIESQLHMGKVCEAINSSDCRVTSVVSHDAGRYLCDYTYYTSLTINCNCTAFIHVPPLGSPYSAIELAEAIKIAIMNMLEQLDEHNHYQKFIIS